MKSAKLDFDKKPFSSCILIQEHVSAKFGHVFWFQIFVFSDVV